REDRPDDHPAPPDHRQEHGGGRTAERSRDPGPSRAGQGARDPGAARAPEAHPPGPKAAGAHQGHPARTGMDAPHLPRPRRGEDMRLGFLELPADERRLYIEQAALWRNLAPVILEKDFWVCWLLGIVFESEFADSLVFKGGTSLSKVFGVIDRFSEDIDLSLSPAFLKLPEAGTSRNQASKWMTRAEAACGIAVRDQIGPALEAAVAGVLGTSERPWFEFLTDSHTNSPVLLFHYPSSQPAGLARRSVKLEFGSLTDQQPVGRHPIRPWLADALPEAFPAWRCEVVALEVERSFREKATILHTEYHRPA